MYLLANAIADRVGIPSILAYPLAGPDYEHSYSRFSQYLGAARVLFDELARECPCCNKPTMVENALWKVRTCEALGWAATSWTRLRCSGTLRKVDEPLGAKTADVTNLLWRSLYRSARSCCPRSEETVELGG